MVQVFNAKSSPPYNGIVGVHDAIRYVGQLFTPTDAASIHPYFTAANKDRRGKVDLGALIPARAKAHEAIKMGKSLAAAERIMSP